MGPTASGKTTLAIELSQRLPVEIISVDSALIYRDMNIGTAKPTPDILRQIPHRLIDIRDPSQIYSAGEFYQDAVSAIENIIKKKRLPLLVGGTMFYFRVLQQGISMLPQTDHVVRQRLRQELQQQGIKKLYERLTLLDPHGTQRIHPNDSQRLLRALETIEITNKTLIELQQSSLPVPPSYRFINIALVPTDRKDHRAHIVNRFQAMLRQGFIEEVKNLFQRSDLHTELPAIRTVGYRQIWDHLAKKLTFAAMQERAIIATCQVAKRQTTWLRSWKNLFIFPNDTDNQLSKIIDLIQANLE